MAFLTIPAIMRIAVCLKRVPDSETKVRLAADGLSLDPSGVGFDLGPYDEYAVEEALKIRDAAATAGAPPGEVVVLCAGPAEAVVQIRKALAMGADRGILVKGEFPFSDAASVGAALAAVLKELSPDLCLTGKQAIDSDNLQVPAFLAQALGWPMVSVVTKLELINGNTGNAGKAGKALAHRQVEGGHEMVEVPLPAVITCQKGLNTPRFASLPNIMKAKKKPLEERTVVAASPLLKVLGLALPPGRKPGRIIGQGPDAAPLLVKALHEEAKVV